MRPHVLWSVGGGAILYTDMGMQGSWMEPCDLMKLMEEGAKALEKMRGDIGHLTVTAWAVPKHWDSQPVELGVFAHNEQCSSAAVETPQPVTYKTKIRPLSQNTAALKRRTPAQRAPIEGDHMTVIAHSIAQAMADYENEHRYELENGSQSTGVEPYEHSAPDFEQIASFVANRLEGAVSREADPH